MSKKQFLKRHILIINKLRQKPCSLIELQKHLERESQYDEENYEISKRTFQRDINEIQSLYNIEIKFNRKEGVYEMIENQNSVNNDRLFETFTILNTLQIAQNFDQEIIFEQRKAQGLENCMVALHAIKNNFQITFLHKKYWEEFAIFKNLQPFVLKESRNRWYIMGLDADKNQIRTFGLDRISDIAVTKIKFTKPSKLFIETKFKNSFGVIYDENDAQKVVLQISNFQANYIKALPLHTTQKVLSEDENYCIIQLEIYPTYDFIMEILSLGKEVTVLEPQDLKQKIKHILSETLGNY
jgi:predicted DNA-binding transcriptional regulator YafY